MTRIMAGILSIGGSVTLLAATFFPTFISKNCCTVSNRTSLASLQPPVESDHQPTGVEGACPDPATDPKNPILNFEELWGTFHRRYAFFELRGVDWNRQHEIYRPQITAQTSDEVLFDILCKMLSTLNDGHVGLESNEDEFEAGPEPRFYQEFDDDQIKQLFQVTSATLKRAGFGNEIKATGMLRFASSAELGYLRIGRFAGPSQARLNRALDRILKHFESRNGLIIDIRDNPGGEDILAYTIAQRFVGKRRLGHYKMTRRGPGNDDYSPREDWHLDPGDRPSFTGPIVLLAHDASFSAAEVFALALDQLPHVTIVGERTYGVFSDQLEKDLPNGWSFSLSHQKYFSPAGICYEGRGVPVDYQVLNTVKDLENSEDSVIAFALKLLQP